MLSQDHAEGVVLGLGLEVDQVAEPVGSELVGKLISLHLPQHILPDRELSSLPLSGHVAAVLHHKSRCPKLKQILSNGCLLLLKGCVQGGEELGEDLLLQAEGGGLALLEKAVESDQLEKDWAEAFADERAENGGVLKV